jgi:hypothetical protein
MKFSISEFLLARLHRRNRAGQGLCRQAAAGLALTMVIGAGGGCAHFSDQSNPDAIVAPGGPISPIIAASVITLSDYMVHTNHRMVWVTRPLGRKLDPTNSTDSHFDWWPSRNTNEWIEAAFAKPERLSQIQVYWFDDSQKRGGCSLPVSWRAFYKDHDQWKPVKTTDAFTVTKNQYDKVAFKPVKTTGMRLEIQLKTNWSGGIESWKVE